MRDYPVFSRGPAWLMTGLLFCSPLLAGEASVPADVVPERGGLFGTGILDPEGKWMLGDWGGRREQLMENGLTLHFGYTSEFAANVTGGDRRSTAYADQWVFAGNLDTKKAGWWDDGMFRVAWTNRNGTELGKRAGLGTNQQTQEVYGRGSYLRLTQMWYEHRFDDVLLLKGGLTSMGEDFFNVPADFQNLTFIASLMGNIAGDYILNWPVSQWGARAKVNPDGEWSLLVGVYEANPCYIDSEWVSQKGWYPNIPGGATGVIVPVELSWNPTFGGKPGRYFVGAWGSSDSGDDPVYDIDGGLQLLTGDPARVHHSRYGFYFGISQYVIGKPEDDFKARVFFRFVQADKETQVNDRQIALGMIIDGMFGRKRDSLGVALGTTHYNDNLRRAVEVYNATTGSDLPERKNEYVAEVFYKWSPTPWLYFQPNVQYIHRPGGTSQNHDALVFGLKSSVSF